MDPVSAGLGIVGLGIQLFAGQKQAQNAQQQAQVSMGITQDESQINSLKYQQQQLEAKRSVVQNYRNAQRARAEATESAVTSGSQYGSGIQGKTAGITDTLQANVLGISQANQIAAGVFAQTNDITSKRIQMAQLGAEGAADQGLSSLGGAVMKAGPVVGAFGQDIYGGVTKGNWGFKTA